MSIDCSCPYSYIIEYIRIAGYVYVFVPVLKNSILLKCYKVKSIYCKTIYIHDFCSDITTPE